MTPLVCAVQMCVCGSMRCVDQEVVRASFGLIIKEEIRYSENKLGTLMSQELYSIISSISTCRSFYPYLNSQVVNVLVFQCHFLLSRGQ